MVSSGFLIFSFCFRHFEIQPPLLPIHRTEKKKIDLVGPFVKALGEHNGFWSYSWPDDSLRIVTIWDGVKSKLGAQQQLLYAKGCGVQDVDTSGFAEARRVAIQSDVIIVSIGEAPDMSGEAKSKSRNRETCFQCQVYCRSSENDTKGSPGEN